MTKHKNQVPTKRLATRLKESFFHGATDDDIYSRVDLFIKEEKERQELAQQDKQQDESRIRDYISRPDFAFAFAIALGAFQAIHTAKLIYVCDMATIFENDTANAVLSYVASFFIECLVLYFVAVGDGLASQVSAGMMIVIGVASTASCVLITKALDWNQFLFYLAINVVVPLAIYRVSEQFKKLEE